jgi:ATP-dependent DNA ligase
MSSVDGELYVPDGNAGDAAHAIAECSNKLEFVPFAVPWWKGLDIATWDIIATSSTLLEITSLKFCPTFFCSNEDNEERLLQDAVDLGIEGWVLKDSNYTGWWKVKPTKSIDGIVTGFKDGEGKYLGLTGALIISVFIEEKLCEVAAVSGMTDAVRIDIDEDNNLGRVCEVEYQELGNGRRLIHPRFVRWRNDKPADECIYEWSEL